MAKKVPPIVGQLYCRTTLTGDDEPAASNVVRVYRHASDRSRYLEIRPTAGGIEVSCGNGRLRILPHVSNCLEIKIVDNFDLELPSS